MGLTPVEHGNFMAALEGVANLKGPGKAGAAEDQNTEWPGFLGSTCIRKPSQSEGPAGRSRNLDELSSRGRRHGEEHARRFPEAQPHKIDRQPNLLSQVG